MKILYVDDIAFDCLLFHTIFKHDFDLMLAGSGKEALQILAADPFVEVVVSDWNMPVMDGVSLVCHIHKYYPGKTCFLLSGCTNYSEIRPYVEAGIIRRFLHKPVDKELLLNEINKIRNTDAGSVSCLQDLFQSSKVWKI